MADLEPGIKLSTSTIEAMGRVSAPPSTVDLMHSTSSPPVTLDTVGDYYFTDAFARNAVKAGISQQDFIRLLLKEYSDLQETFIKALKDQPPVYHAIQTNNKQK